MPVVVGAPRSGTTLLRFMLDSHPLLAIPPETGFLPSVCCLSRTGQATPASLCDLLTTFPGDAPVWPDFNLETGALQQALTELYPFRVSEGLRTFYRLYAARHQKPRYGDKTPGYCEHMGAIGELLPESHFIHMIRDGRDAALSLRPLWFAPGRDMATLASHWARQVTTARQAGSTAQAYMEVRYEDLVRQPEAVLVSVCRFVGLPFDPAMLRYWERTPQRLREHKARARADGSVVVSRQQRLRQQKLTTRPPQESRVFAWKNELTDHERTEFARFAGDALREFDYEL